MSTLPDYSPSPPAPRYSKDVGPSEVVLSSIPIERNGYMNFPRSTFVHISRNGAMVLRNQEEGRTWPAYGPHSSHIFGSVAIAARERIEVVRLKISGVMILLVPGSSEFHHLVDFKEVLWRRDESGSSCPGSLPFSYHLPESWTHNGRAWALPPSFRLPMEDVWCDDFLKIAYFIMVEIKSSPRRRFLSSSKIRRFAIPTPSLLQLQVIKVHASIRVPFSYEKRTMPWRPLLDSRSPLSTLKSNPEEWISFSETILPRAGHHLAPVGCTLLVPSIQVYSAADTITFHLQLFGAAESMKDLSEILPTTFARREKPESLIRVALIRHVLAFAEGRERRRNIILDKVSLHSLPPPSVQEDSTNYYDWAGTLRPGDVGVGSFITYGASVKDMIVVSIAPSQRSLFGSSLFLYPIRLVSISPPDS